MTKATVEYVLISLIWVFLNLVVECHRTLDLVANESTIIIAQTLPLDHMQNYGAYSQQYK
jgi:hypothetical protein